MTSATSSRSRPTFEEAHRQLKLSAEGEAGTARGGRRARVSAETMATRQRDISVSEFFAKNRHLLGFDNPRKALLTTVKEAVDNALDACEEAGILPDITVVIEELSTGGESGTKSGAKGSTGGEPGGGNGSGGGSGGGGAGGAKAAAKSSRYRVTIVDNGPGIVRKQVEHIFGRLLYGSKFHRLKMSRGQQGIGISAAGMYGLLTTGRPMVIHTKPDADAPAHHIELAMNTKTNRAEVTVDTETDDFPLARLRTLLPAACAGEFLSASDYPTGTSVSIELEGRYQRGRGSVDEFLELTAIANPHARITFVPPSRTMAEEAEDAELLMPRARAGIAPGDVGGGEGSGGVAAVPDVMTGVVSGPVVQTTERDGVIVFPRAVSELPAETKEIQPHPKGVELGTLLQMLKDFEAANKGGGTLYNFLQEQFSRVSSSAAGGFCQKVGVTSRTKVGDIDHALGEKLFRELQEAKLPPPPTDCLAPIGVRQLLAGMLKGVRAEFYAASTREAAVYRGRPFQIEAAIAFGGELPKDEAARVIRFANRVPLLYQQSACSSFKAVTDTNWRNYDLQHPRGGLPVGPLVVMIHMASVWVPFTSESKEAVADYDEIRKEMKLALMECGRKLGTYIRKRARMRREGERRDIFERYIGEITRAVHEINGTDEKRLFAALQAQAKKRTAVADLQLDEDGKAVKDDPADIEGVVVVAEANAVGGAAAAGGTKPGMADASGAEAAAEGGRKAASHREKPVGKRKPRDQERDSRVESGGRKTGNAKSDNPVKAGPPAQAARAAKPKMRLVNGRLVPVDDAPGLF